MGDRTWLQATIHDCPPNQAQAVLDVLDEYGVHPDEDIPAPDGHLTLGTTYVNQEILCGSAQEIAARLQVDAPAAAWELWEDPRLDWPGDIWRYTPILGAWTAQCSSQGTPVFSDDHIRDLHTRVTHPPTLHELDNLLGIEHSRALAALLAQNTGASQGNHTTATVDPDTGDDPADTSDLIEDWRTSR
jgi:hypothetical protein